MKRGPKPFIRREAVGMRESITGGLLALLVVLGSLLALAYFVLPTDMVPDFITGFGFTDDATVLAFAIGAVAQAIKERHRAQAREALKAGPPDEHRQPS